MILYFYIGLAFVSWLVFLISFSTDRSRYRNCFLLFFSIVNTLAAATFLGGEHQKETILAIMLLLLLTVLCVPFFLIANGVLMFKREGHSLANLLSFAFGVLIGFGELATFYVLVSPAFIEGANTRGMRAYDINTAFYIISISVIYISIVFVIFMLYSLFLQVVPRKKNFDYIIIHGCGLLGGKKVSKLLADRLDKAIDVYHKDPTPTIMIPSGGKGSDEEVSEAEAMAGYLIEKGIPEDRIIKEDQSATTFENLANSKAIIDAREGSKYTALVTSNYHVYRALRYCRKVDLKCTGIGSHVAFYYWPSALIREFIAVHAEKKHFIQLMIGWLICIAPIVIHRMAQ